MFCFCTFLKVVFYKSKLILETDCVGELWGKNPNNIQGYLGGTGVISNNLTYIYNFKTNLWEQFIQLDSMNIESYTCTTYYSKDGKGWVMISWILFNKLNSNFYPFRKVLALSSPLKPNLLGLEMNLWKIDVKNKVFTKSFVNFQTYGTTHFWKPKILFKPDIKHDFFQENWQPILEYPITFWKVTMWNYLVTNF